MQDIFHLFLYDHHSYMITIWPSFWQMSCKIKCMSIVYFLYKELLDSLVGILDKASHRSMEYPLVYRDVERGDDDSNIGLDAIW